MSVTVEYVLEPNQHANPPGYGVIARAFLQAAGLS